MPARLWATRSSIPDDPIPRARDRPVWNQSSLSVLASAPRLRPGPLGLHAQEEESVHDARSSLNWPASDCKPHDAPNILPASFAVDEFSRAVLVQLAKLSHENA